MQGFKVSTTKTFFLRRLTEFNLIFVLILCFRWPHNCFYYKISAIEPLRCQHMINSTKRMCVYLYIFSETSAALTLVCWCDIWPFWPIKEFLLTTFSCKFTAWNFPYNNNYVLFVVTISSFTNIMSHIKEEMGSPKII